MFRTLTITAALTAAAGFALGWLAFSNAKRVIPGSANRPVAAAPGRPQVWVGKPVPDGSGVPAVVQRFALRPGDVSADRETPAIAITADGTIVLAWASQDQAGDSVRTLYLTRSHDGGKSFDAPLAWRTVPIYRFTSDNPAKERKMAFSTHVLPRLASTRADLALGWVEAIDGGPTVRFLVARSKDGGKTFTAPVPAHSENASRPGFTTLTATPDGGLACGWLTNQQPFFSDWSVDSEGFAPEQRVYAGPEGKGVCPCCDVAVAVTSDRQTFVAFRNSEAGHRDIWIAHGRPSAGGEPRFAAPVPVGSQPWTFNGCPHDGPSLALVGGNLHAAWMDAHTGTSRVYHAVTPIGELTFHPRPLSLEGRSAQGHPRLAAGREGILHAVWDEGLASGPPAVAGSEHVSDGGQSSHDHAVPAAAGGGRAIMYSVSRDGGATFTPAHALIPNPAAYQLQPALAVGPDGTVYVAWNEIDEDGKHVAFARLARPNPAQESATP